MNHDFLQDLEFLGVTARIKRLSDALGTSIRDFYRANDVDLEPSWHLVLLLLQDRTATLTEIARSLHLSQPAMTKLIGRMTAKGYLEVQPDATDSRKKNICLSDQARQRLPAFERLWSAGQAAIREILEADTAFLDGLAALETQLVDKDFAERALAQLDQGQDTHGDTA